MSMTIEGLTEDFVNLRQLSMNGVGLTSLKGLPALPNLQRLDLADNRISGGLQTLKECPRLDLLNLSNNNIKDLETLEPLKELPALKSLDLYGNDITNMEDYRSTVFEYLPGLTYLDGTDAENNEAGESEGEGEADEAEPAPVNGKAAGAGAGEVSESFKTRNGSESSPESFELSLEERQLGLGATEEVDDSSSVADGDPEEGEDVDEEAEDDDDLEDEEDEDAGDDGVEDGPEDEDEDDEEDDEEEEPVVGLKDIYREDLETQSDDGEYEEEEDDSDSSEPQCDDETGYVPSPEPCFAELDDDAEYEEPELIDLEPDPADVVGEPGAVEQVEAEAEQGPRGVKRPRENDEEHEAEEAEGGDEEKLELPSGPNVYPGHFNPTIGPTRLTKPNTSFPIGFFNNLV